MQTMLIPEITIQDDIKYPITNIISISDVTSQRWNNDQKTPDEEQTQKNNEHLHKNELLTEFMKDLCELERIYYNFLFNGSFGNPIILQKSNSNQIEKINEKLYNISNLVQKIDQTKRSNCGFKFEEEIQKIGLELYDQDKGNIPKLEKFINNGTKKDDFWSLESLLKSIIGSNEVYLNNHSIVQPNFKCTVTLFCQETKNPKQIEEIFYFDSEDEANKERSRIIQETHKIWGNLNGNISTVN